MLFMTILYWQSNYWYWQKKLIIVLWHKVMSIPKTADKLWNITVREPLKSKLEVALHFQCNTTESMKQNCLTWVRINVCGKLQVICIWNIHLASLVKWWFDILIFKKKNNLQIHYLYLPTASASASFFPICSAKSWTAWALKYKDMT